MNLCKHTAELTEQLVPAKVVGTSLMSRSKISECFSPGYIIHTFYPVGFLDSQKPVLHHLANRCRCRGPQPRMSQVAKLWLVGNDKTRLRSLAVGTRSISIQRVGGHWMTSGGLLRMR